MQNWTTMPPPLHAQPLRQFHVLLLTPIVTLCLLSLLVRTASSAVDVTREKHRVAAQLKQRLTEVQDDGLSPGVTGVEPSDPPPASLPVGLPSTWAPYAPLQRAEHDSTDRPTAELAPDPLFGFLLDPLDQQVVRLTVAFEQGPQVLAEAFGTVGGDFDGQGMSFGLLQWNLGSCTLQPLLQAFQRANARRFRAVFGPGAAIIGRLMTVPCAEAPQLAREMLLNEEGRVKEEWVKRFRTLGRERAFQEVQLRHLLPPLHKAYDLATTFGLRSERAIALLFDILVQNGGISSRVRERYEQDIRWMQRKQGYTPDEVERMVILARHQAAGVNPRWIKLVQARKLTIALGTGEVNGIRYNLENLAIELKDHRTGEVIPRNPEKPQPEKSRHGQRTHQG